MPQNERIRAVRAALEQNRAVNLHRDRIEITEDGDTLVLDGEVENIVAKRRAMQTARETLGDARVLDRLKIRVVEPTGDQALAQAVIHTFGSEPAFQFFSVGPEPPAEARNDWIAVGAEQGRVTLQGSVNSLSHRRMAEVLAWWVPGCADVENRIRVAPPENDNDDEINDAVKLVLDKDPTIDAQQISVTTRDGEVTLTGALASEEARRIVGYDCWYIPGVHAVHNRIDVLPHAAPR